MDVYNYIVLVNLHKALTVHPIMSDPFTFKKYNIFTRVLSQNKI